MPNPQDIHSHSSVAQDFEVGMPTPPSDVRGPRVVQPGGEDVHSEGVSSAEHRVPFLAV